MTLQPLPTNYAGCRFRSRLEARWAVFFDRLGIEWEYEPEGFATSAGRYLPDFRIRVPSDSNFPYWFEVKPDRFRGDLRHSALAAGSGAPVIVASGIPRSYDGQMGASRAAGRDTSVLRMSEGGAWVPCAFSSGWPHWSSGGYPCVLHKGRVWHQEGFDEAHIVLYPQDCGCGFAPIEDRRIDAAYSAAVSERFGT